MTSKTADTGRVYAPLGRPLPAAPFRADVAEALLQRLAARGRETMAGRPWRLVERRLELSAPLSPGARGGRPSLAPVIAAALVAFAAASSTYVQPHRPAPSRPGPQPDAPAPSALARSLPALAMALHAPAPRLVERPSPARRPPSQDLEAPGRLATLPEPVAVAVAPSAPPERSEPPLHLQAAPSPPSLQPDVVRPDGGLAAQAPVEARADDDVLVVRRQSASDLLGLSPAGRSDRDALSGLRSGSPQRMANAIGGARGP